MMITQAQIRRAVGSVDKERLDEFVAAWNMWSEPYEINTPQRAAMFLANVMHESGNLAHFEENLNYSVEGLQKVFGKYFKTSAEAAAYAHKPQQIANRVYANRMGNGDEKSGDGWRYRGRGSIMITGKSNVKAYSDSELCEDDVLSKPLLLTKFPHAYKSAMWFWQKNGCNQLADRNDFEGVVKRINGGTLGLSNRMYLYRKFCREYGLKA